MFQSKNVVKPFINLDSYPHLTKLSCRPEDLSLANLLDIKRPIILKLTLGIDFPQDLFGILPKEQIKRLVITTSYYLDDDNLKLVMAFDRVKLKLSNNIKYVLAIAMINRFAPKKELAFDDC